MVPMLIKQGKDERYYNIVNAGSIFIMNLTRSPQ